MPPNARNTGKKCAKFTERAWKSSDAVCVEEPTWQVLTGTERQLPDRSYMVIYIH